MIEKAEPGTRCRSGGPPQSWFSGDLRTDLLVSNTTGKSIDLRKKHHTARLVNQGNVRPRDWMDYVAVGYKADQVTTPEVPFSSCQPFTFHIHINTLIRLKLPDLDGLRHYKQFNFSFSEQVYQKCFTSQKNYGGVGQCATDTQTSPIRRCPLRCFVKAPCSQNER